MKSPSSSTMIRLLLTLLLLFSASRESRAGESAEVLFPLSGIQQVRISPAGDWIIAYARHGQGHGILVQRTATGEVANVFATTIPLRRVDWIDQDTIIADFVGGYRRRTMVVTFRASEQGLEFDLDWISPFGRLVDPLPLVDDEVIWVIDQGNRQALHRVDVEKLIDYGQRGGRRRLVGTRLALVEGEIGRWIVDRSGRPRAIQRRDEDGYTILVRDKGDSQFHEIHSFKDRDDDSMINLMSLSRDQHQIIVAAYNGNDTLGLFELDPETGKLGELIFHRENADITNVIVDPITRELIAAVYDEAGETRYHYFSSYGMNRLVGLSEEFPRESVAIVSSSADRRSFVFRVSSATNPGAHYYRDLRSGATMLIAERGADIDRTSLIDARSFVVKSQDGTEIEAFLTLPEPETGRGRAAPLVVMPHGGPSGVRDRKRYNPLVQYLASWGFAILQPNYRGSSGYGREFKNSGKKAWAKGIEDDIDAAVEYAMALPEIDADRICIYGGSYGGFSALASVVRHQDRYRCAISLNGVSDIPLLYDSSDVADSKRSLDFYEEFVGNLETERDKLIEVSPAYHVKEIETPVFMIFGTADRRVDPDHSHRMLLMLENYGKEHVSLEVEGMTHGPDRDEWVQVARAIREYLSRFLFPAEEPRPDSDIAVQESRESENRPIADDQASHDSVGTPELDPTSFVDQGEETETDDQQHE